MAIYMARQLQVLRLDTAEAEHTFPLYCAGLSYVLRYIMINRSLLGMRVLNCVSCLLYAPLYM
jgi:hypothetical protein